MNTLTKLATATYMAAALVAATGAQANTSFKIEGATDTLEAGCSFLNVNDGSMAWDEAQGIWYTTNDGQVRVKVRDVASVVVAYDASALTWENPRKSPTSSVGANDYTVTGLAGGNVLNLKIDHTLTTSDSYVAESNTAYHLVNVVTCNL